MNGWGPKSSVCPLKPRETKLLGRISRDFCRDILEVPEKFEKRVCVHFLAAKIAAKKGSRHFSAIFLFIFLPCWIAANAEELNLVNFGGVWTE